ncbi:protein LURP-one-related 8-like [Curcuma longa]|uniref:protein LURP-one-related 8-like n=1 Tax=Curcuma longa TaxID=136217 RepID=UPI003D9E22AA
MTKVHPNASRADPIRSESESSYGGGGKEGKAVVFTVWRKSLLFNGNGFTVFDATGNLVFRVENYSSGSRNEIVLMDAAGKPLLTIRRKKLSLGDHWLIYNGEESSNPQFAIKKHKSFWLSKVMARVTPYTSGAKACLTYDIEGSYSERCCTIYDNNRQKMAEIKRKESAQGIPLGLDVFRLIVELEFDSSLAMAAVILLEQMFGSRGSLLRG